MMSLEVVIVSNSPIYAAALQHWLEDGANAFRCRRFGGDAECEPAELDANAVLLVAPNDWREMTRWLPCLRKLFAGRSWLILADLRLAGMCWPDLEAQLCTLVAPEAPPDRLRVALWVLAERHALCSPAALMELFACAAAPAMNGNRVYLTPKELQCACAVSLGLSNRQIAAALHLGEGTVKSHVHHLLRKVRVTDREELAAYVERVFASPTPWEMGLLPAESGATRLNGAPVRLRVRRRSVARL